MGYLGMMADEDLALWWNRAGDRLGSRRRPPPASAEKCVSPTIIKRIDCEAYVTWDIQPLSRSRDGARVRADAAHPRASCARAALRARHARVGRRIRTKVAGDWLGSFITVISRFC